MEKMKEQQRKRYGRRLLEDRERPGNARGNCYAAHLRPALKADWLTVVEEVVVVKYFCWG